MDRKDKLLLNRELMDLLLKDTKDDDQYFNRLLYALQLISSALNRFEIMEWGD